MAENPNIVITFIDKNVVNVCVPEIGVDHYPVYRADSEEDVTFTNRAESYAMELFRRYRNGDPYAIGYREWKDGKIRLVIRKCVDGVIYQRAIGFDEDFRPI